MEGLECSNKAVRTTRETHRTTGVRGQHWAFIKYSTRMLHDNWSQSQWHCTVVTAPAARARHSTQQVSQHRSRAPCPVEPSPTTPTTFKMADSQRASPGRSRERDTDHRTRLGPGDLPRPPSPEPGPQRPGRVRRGSADAITRDGPRGARGVPTRYRRRGHARSPARERGFN